MKKNDVKNIYAMITVTGKQNETLEAARDR
jgi:hypothetical protein